MTQLFSADTPGQGAWKRPLLLGSLVLVAALAGWVLSTFLYHEDAGLIALTGAGVWVAAAIAAYFRPGRAALALAILGALIIGTGVLTRVYGQTRFSDLIIRMGS